MEEEFEVKVNHHALKLMKKISRNNNIIPGNRYIKDKKKYNRRKENVQELLNLYYTEEENE